MSWFEAMRYVRLMFIALVAIGLVACQKDHHTVAGYIEGDFTYMSSSQSGRLMALDVHRGEWVKPGQVLFQIDQQPYRDQVAEALASVKQAQGDFQDLLTGKRKPRLDELQAQIEQAQAKVIYAALQEKRNQKLVATHSVQIQELDLARQDLQVARAQVKQYRNALKYATLPARPKQIVAADAALGNAKATLAQMQWTLQQTTVKAPAKAQVFDNFYWVGEQVPAQHAVVSLLVPGNVRVLFYIPEPMLSQMKVGQQITFSADGSKAVGKATISYIAPHAEYTPPVIYSRESQSKLVYRVEARFDSLSAAKQWHPGQPVTIQLPESA